MYGDMRAKVFLWAKFLTVLPEKLQMMKLEQLGRKKNESTILLFRHVRLSDKGIVGRYENLVIS